MIILFPKNKRHRENTLNLVIFGWSRFREFVIVGLFTTARNCDLSISMRGGTHDKKNSRDSQICKFVLLAKFLKIKTSRILPDRQYINYTGVGVPSEIFYSWAT